MIERPAIEGTAPGDTGGRGSGAVDAPPQRWEYAGGPIGGRYEDRPRISWYERVHPCVCLFSARKPGWVHVYVGTELLHLMDRVELSYTGLLTIDAAHVWVVRCKKREGQVWKGPDADAME